MDVKTGKTIGNIDPVFEDGQQKVLEMRRCFWEILQVVDRRLLDAIDYLLYNFADKRTEFGITLPRFSPPELNGGDRRFCCAQQRGCLSRWKRAHGDEQVRLGCRLLDCLQNGSSPKPEHWSKGFELVER